MTTKHLLDQIVRGLDGVTAGPWDIKEETGWDEAWCDWHDVGPFSLMGPKADANSKHIARCSPDAIREIAAYVRELEQSRDDYKSDYFRRHKDATDHLERAVIAELRIRDLEDRLAKAAEALEAADPYVEICHSLMTARGPRANVWRVLKQVRATLSQIRSEK